jgi:hypothetical protein
VYEISSLQRLVNGYLACARQTGDPATIVDFEFLYNLVYGERLESACLDELDDLCPDPRKRKSEPEFFTSYDKLYSRLRICCVFSSEPQNDSGNMNRHAASTKRVTFAVKSTIGLRLSTCDLMSSTLIDRLTWPEDIAHAVAPFIFAG